MKPPRMLVVCCTVLITEYADEWHIARLTSSVSQSPFSAANQVSRERSRRHANPIGASAERSLSPHGRERTGPTTLYKPHAFSMSLLNAATLYMLVTVTLVNHEGTDAKAIKSFAGPWIVYADRFSVCENEGDWKWNLRVTHFNPQKPNDLQLISGNLTVSRSVNDSSWARANLAVRNNNQWKQNAFIFEFKDKACSLVTVHIPGFYRTFFGKVRDPCVLRAGLYEVDREPIDWTFPKVPIMPYGHYLFKLRFGYEKDTVACVLAECHVVPKQ
ncbi:uncharacterized protein LOC113215181 isoform X2 [Frankliniella occidentalis]|uniref:Uncharacterized protein LOC113215181 isoform X2 n=1 Tax=Frankliniella occidentalis TaxID=133901 RepID=A0A9C6UC71_FRAOC|nr:uncharacterized protein LOC113215181 isoform X2 [Frankliniella occidentalis]